MKLKLTLLAAAAALMSAGAANAQDVTKTFNEGTGGLSMGETLFADFDVTDGGVSGGLIQSGGNGFGADPAVGGMGDNYLTVVGGGAASFDFTTLGGLTQLGLDFGSADAYNFFTLFLTGGMAPSITFNGQDIIDIGTADGNQVSNRTNGRLTFFANPGVRITGLNLTSTSNSLETDNYGITAAVPEPSTWAMMLFGFGAIGFGMRRSRRSNSRILQVA
jgi:hypothetical protein